MTSPMPSLFITRRMPDAVERRAQESYDCRMNRTDEAHDQDGLIEGAEGCQGIMTCATDKWPEDVIEALPDTVRIIATLSVGFEHIDLGACRSRGIAVTNTPDVLSESTADTTMLCLLGAARRASEGERMVRDGDWTGWAPTQLLGIELNGAHLGIVGMGRIGRAVAARARGFGMIVHYHNRSRLPEELEQGAIYHDRLEAMLPKVRFLSLNAPGGEATKHLLNDRTLAMLPKGAVVVNTARGLLIDDDALIRAMTDGHVFAAGLDVFNGEPDLDARYRAMPNTFLLPHLGSATVETRNAMGFRCLDNLDAVLLRGERAPDDLTRVS